MGTFHMKLMIPATKCSTNMNEKAASHLKIMMWQTHNQLSILRMMLFVFLSHCMGRSKCRAVVYLRYTPGITNHHSNHWDITNRHGYQMQKRF